MGVLPSAPMVYVGVLVVGEARGESTPLLPRLPSPLYAAASGRDIAMDSAHGVFLLAASFALRRARIDILSSSGTILPFNKNSKSMETIACDCKRNLVSWTKMRPALFSRRRRRPERWQAGLLLLQNATSHSVLSGRQLDEDEEMRRAAAFCQEDSLMKKKDVVVDLNCYA